MLGVIVGDIIGSVHEWAGTKTKNLSLFVPESTFTDDTVLTVAVAEWLLTDRDLTELLQDYYHAFPACAYGGMFHDWASRRRREPYNSYGNGSAMRVSPVGSAFDGIEDVLAPLDDIRPTSGFDATCQGTVPQALRSFLESTSYEDAIRNAISLGGDADTLACIAGGVAEAYYGVPQDLADKATRLLDARLVAVIDRFRDRYGLASKTTPGRTEWKARDEK